MPQNEIVVNGKTYVEKKTTYKTVYTITMPNVGSWNGKFSGASKLYCKVFPYKSKTDDTLIGRSFYYNFGDGWGASVSVDKVESKEAAKMKKLSSGFMGYEWMIDSINRHGCIKIQG